MEQFVKQNTNNPQATYYPQGELVISKDCLKGTNAFVLSWKFTISSLEPNNEQLIYVNALNGEVINNIPLILDANTQCTAQTLYSGIQTITGDSFSGGIRLRETRNGVSVLTLNMNNSYNYSNAIDFTNNSTNWSSGNWASFSQDQWALDAHWGAERVLDFWRTIFSRNSIDGNGLRVLSYVHYTPYSSGNSWANAQWVAGSNSNFMQYGDGNGLFKPLTALDVCAHEFGHGITQFTASLTYSYEESGALNEGFSDIWAACVEHWAAPNKQTWLIGEEIFNSTVYSCLRSLQNPKSTSAAEGQHPNTYHGDYWDHNGEQHNNSTVLSHWFYLLSNGGSGTNDLGNSYSVSGIGISDAQSITFRAESMYLNSSASYSDARSATIQAAIDMFGENSCKVINTTNAWYAVGVGPQFEFSNVTLSGTSTVCSVGSTYSISNLSTDCTVQWSSSTNISITSASGNSATFTTNGSGNGWIEAFINSSCGVNSTKRINVVVGSPTPTITAKTNSVEGEPITYLFTATPYSNATYSWYVNNTLQDELGNTFDLYIPCRHTSTVKCSLSNTCGTSPFSNSSTKAGSCTKGSTYSVSPNPVSTELTIKESHEQSTSRAFVESTPIYLVQIYDRFGTLVLQRSYPQGTSEVRESIANLPRGIYVVKVNEGEQQESTTIIKE